MYTGWCGLVGWSILEWTKRSWVQFAVWSTVRVCTGGNQSVILPHIDSFFSLFLSISLPSSLSESNEKSTVCELEMLYLIIHTLCVNLSSLPKPQRTHWFSFSKVLLILWFIQLGLCCQGSHFNFLSHKQKHLGTNTWNKKVSWKEFN